MSILNKILVSSVSAMMMFSVVNPVSAENKKEETSDVGAILFRIENIKPIANEDGLINKCTFMLTAFNRMEKAVSEANLNLKWEDNISAKHVVKNQKLEVKTGNDAKTIVTTQMKLLNIAPHSQKSFEGQVETDKCFLLFDNLEYTVDSCTNEGDVFKMKNSKIVDKSKGCADNFDYIDSKNPEYYSEFKDIPESVLVKQAEEEKNTEVAKITENYNKSMSTINKIGTVLGTIQ